MACHKSFLPTEKKKKQSIERGKRVMISQSKEMFVAGSVALDDIRRITWSLFESPGGCLHVSDILFRRYKYHREPDGISKRFFEQAPCL
jgi:hypothetical protein